jgi:DNA-binding NarL/FixJ family response regulator
MREPTDVKAHSPLSARTALIIHDSVSVETTPLKEHFASVTDVILIEESGGLERLSARCERFPRCVLVVGAAFAEGLDPAFLQKVLTEHPAPCMIAFLERPHEEIVDELLVHGYYGILTPQTSPAIWEKMVRCVTGGEMWVQRAVLTRVIRRLILYDACKLSHRESEILTLLVEGLTNRAIAERLYLTQETIRWHLRQLYGKTGVGSRRNLFIYATRYVEAMKLRDALSPRVRA